MGVHEQDSVIAGTAAADSGSRAAVASVSCNDVYSFTKPTRDEITLIAGLGVEGDVHAGVTVRHRSRVRADPTQPNLRQVHLIHAELHDEVRPEGYEVPPGGLGENVTTTGIDLLGLPAGTILRFGPHPAADAETGSAAGAEAVLAAAGRTTLDAPAAAAVAALAASVQAAGHITDPRPAVVVTGLRNPCQQINTYRAGLLKQVLDRDSQGNLVRKAGVMAVVLRGGTIRPGDPIGVELPPAPHLPLDRV